MDDITRTAEEKRLPRNTTFLYKFPLLHPHGAGKCAIACKCGTFTRMQKCFDMTIIIFMLMLDAVTFVVYIRNSLTNFYKKFH